MTDKKRAARPQMIEIAAMARIGRVLSDLTETQQASVLRALAEIYPVMAEATQ